MRPYLWRDVGAIAAGMTPSNGYTWPSQAGGVAGVPLDVKKVPGALDRRLSICALLLMWASLASAFIVGWQGAAWLVWVFAVTQLVFLARAVVVSRIARQRLRDVMMGLSAIDAARHAIAHDVLMAIESARQAREGEEPPPEPERDTTPGD